MDPQPLIRAVIFDMDGVLTDSEPLINAAAVAMFREKGHIVQPEDFLPFVGTGEDRYIGGVAEKHAIPLNLPEAKRRTYEIYLDLVPQRLNSFPGAVQLVQACRNAGLRVAVASSADRVKVLANLRHIGLPETFWDVIITGEDVVAKKPAPDIFLLAASRLEVAPEMCVVVEDAVNGVQAAKRAGMRCVAVAQSFPADRLAQADLVRDRIAAVTLDDLQGRGLAPSQPSGASMRDAVASPPPLPPPLPSSAPPRPWGFWATLGLGLAMMLVWAGVQGGVALGMVVVGEASGMHWARADIASDGLVISLATLAGMPIPVLLGWAFMRLRGLPITALGFRPVALGTLAWWSLGLGLLIVASDLATKALGRPVVPEVMREMYATAVWPPLLWAALVIGAPVAEEVLFRGFLLEGWAHSPLGPFWSVIGTSLIWSVIHIQYDAYGIGTIFVTGLFLGWARLKTGSVWTVIVLHGLMNLVATMQTALVQ